MDRTNLAPNHHQRLVKVVHSRANVTGDQIKLAPDGGNSSRDTSIYRQGLFAWSQRIKIGPSENLTSRHSRVSRNTLMSGVASEYIRRGMTDHRGKDDCRG